MKSSSTPVFVKASLLTFFAFLVLSTIPATLAAEDGPSIGENGQVIYAPAEVEETPVPSPEVVEPIFSDIEDSPYKEAILFVQSKKLVKGYGDGTFKPEQKINRAEFVKILLLAKYDDSQITWNKQGQVFSDIKSEDWFSRFVNFSQENEILQGYDDKTFRPNQKINFAEAAKIINNTLFQKTNPKSGADWSLPFEKKLVANNITPASITSNAAEITRGEMAEMIFRIQKLSPETNSVTILNHSYLNYDEEMIKLKGTTSANAKQIDIKHEESNEFYTLRDFALGNTEFEYHISEALENADKGENNYKITVFFEDGTKQISYFVAYFK